MVKNYEEDLIRRALLSFAHKNVGERFTKHFGDARGYHSYASLVQKHFKSYMQYYNKRKPNHVYPEINEYIDEYAKKYKKDKKKREERKKRKEEKKKEEIQKAVDKAIEKYKKKAKKECDKEKKKIGSRKNVKSQVNKETQTKKRKFAREQD